MNIVLSKLIPPDGRKPTGRECLQFKKQNMQVTQSGAWRVGWQEDAAGLVHHSISFFSQKTSTGYSYYFTAIEAELKSSKPATPRRKSASSPSNLDRENTDATWCW